MRAESVMHRFFLFTRNPLNLRWPFHERWRRWKSQMFSQTNTRIHLPANRLVGGLPCRISLFSFSSLSLLTLSLVLSFCLVSCTLHTRWSHHLYMRGGLWRNEKKKKATRSQSRFCYGSEQRPLRERKEEAKNLSFPWSKLNTFSLYVLFLSGTTTWICCFVYALYSRKFKDTR